MKCQLCKNEVAVTAWQPFGPAENCRNGDAFVALGSHHRGFPVIKICHDCSGEIQNGENIAFEYGRGHVEYRLIGESQPKTQLLFGRAR